MRLTFEQREAARRMNSAASVHGPDLIAEARTLASYAHVMDADDIASALGNIHDAKAAFDQAFLAIERAFPAQRENHQNDHIQKAG